MRRKATQNDTVWTEWLTDEPLPTHPQTMQPQVIAPSVRPGPRAAAPDPRARLRNAGTGQAGPTASAQQPVAGVSISISMPTFHRPTWLPRWRDLPWRQVRNYGVLGVTCMVLAIGARAGLGMLPHHSGAKPQDVKGASTAGAEAPPAYAPIVPESKKDLATPGQGKGSYDAARQLYVYDDTLNGANLVVSQQPLPKEVTADPAQMAKIAASVGAKQSFATAFGEAYMSQKEEAGEQRIAFAYQDRLIFIRSDKRFDSESWKFYIESLRKSE